MISPVRQKKVLTKAVLTTCTNVRVQKHWLWLKQRFLLRLVGVSLWLCVPGAVVHAAPSIVRGFDGPRTQWQLLEGVTPAQLLDQGIVRDGARNQSGAERIVVAGAVGHSASVGCATSAMPVLDEFAARMWVKSSRPGVQLAVRVVMPRTIDPRTGAPATAIVRSGQAAYDRPGHWRQLALNGLPKLLAAEVRVMRTLPGANVDPREAFVDAVVMIVPCHPQGIEVVADELEIDGILVAANGSIAQTGVGTGSVAAPGDQASDPYRDLSLKGNNLGPQGEPALRVVGTSLLVEGRMFLPRAIDWNEEPLKFLAERGFNTVRIAGLPTDAQSSEAARHGLWFLSTPPGPESLAERGLAGSSERVLAWYLEDELVQRDPDYFRRWAELVRAQDHAIGRPVVIAPLAEWNVMSKTADMLVADHPLAVRLSRAEFEQWFDERRTLARPGTPFWASIPTQLGAAAARQIAALSGKPADATSIDENQVETLVHAAAMRGIRGYVFESHTSLSADDAAAKHRAALLEMINLRLQQLEPWLAGGKVIGRIAPSPTTQPTKTETAILMQVDHARILVFESTDPPKGETRSFVIPGIPDTNQVYLFSPAGIRPLDARRVAGGKSIVLTPDDEGWVLLTEDPQVVQALRQQIARNASRAARLRRELAAGQLASLSAIDRSLVACGVSTQKAQQHLAETSAALQQTDRLLSESRIEDAYRVAGAARRALRAAAHEQRRAVPAVGEISSSPLALCHGTLAEHAEFVGSRAKLRGGDNKLYGGDFEELHQLLQFGWQNVNRPLPGIDARAELSSMSPHEGKYCLQLTATQSGAAQTATDATAERAGRVNATPVRAVAPALGSPFNDPFQHVPTAESTPALGPVADRDSANDEAIVGVVPSTPVWITSPPVPVEAGRTLEITGSVRVPKPIQGSADGLQIVDTIGGEELAIRVVETSDWQPFQMIRAVPQATELKLSFILTGIGSAQIDGVAVRTLAEPIARRLPPISPTTPMPAPLSSPSESNSPAQLYVTPLSR